VEEYVIWSNEHNSWWAPNRLGYSKSLKGAGIYTREEAIDICFHGFQFKEWNKNPFEIPLLYNDALELEGINNEKA